MIPNEVDAFKWTGGPDQTEDPEWIIDCMKSGRAIICRETEEFNYYDGGKAPIVNVKKLWMEIATASGTMRVDPGDYIVMDEQGHLSTMTSYIFEANHEIIEEDND